MDCKRLRHWKATGNKQGTHIPRTTGYKRQGATSRIYYCSKWVLVWHHLVKLSLLLHQVHQLVPLHFTCRCVSKLPHLLLRFLTLRSESNFTTLGVVLRKQHPLWFIPSKKTKETHEGLRIVLKSHTPCIQAMKQNGVHGIRDLNRDKSEIQAKERD